MTSTLAFDTDGAVNGNGGCNTFRGDVIIDGSSMKFGQLASTMMACEEAKSKQEAIFHAALSRTVSFALESGELSLLDQLAAGPLGWRRHERRAGPFAAPARADQLTALFLNGEVERTSLAAPAHLGSTCALRSGRGD